MENKLINFQKKHQNTFEDFILRPGRFFAKEGGVEAAILGPVLGMKRGIRVDELAVAMIDLGMNGGGAQTMVNEDIVKMGRGLLDGT